MPGSAVPMPGNTVPMPGNAVLMPGNAVLEPGITVLMPGNPVLMPGRAVPIPGSAVLMPGSAVLTPGNAVLMPGSAVPMPGGACSIPDSADLMPDSAGSMPDRANRRLATAARCIPLTVCLNHLRRVQGAGDSSESVRKACPSPNERKIARMTTARANPYPLLLLGGGGLALLAAIVVRTQTFAAHPDLLAWAFTCDLTISLPLLWWLFAVRTGKAGAVTLIPLFVIGVGIAARIIPAAQHSFVDQLRYIAAPLDLVTIALVIRRVARIRRIEGGGDPVDRIERACAEIFGRGYAARAVAFEVSVFYYAFSGWRKRAPSGFTVHQRSGWASVIGVFVFLIGVESIGAHLVVQMWSVKAAWIVTTLDLYGVLWLLGDYQALRLRPTRIDGDTLILSFGLRWHAAIPLSAIAAIEPLQHEAEWKRKGVLKVAILDEPRLLIRFAPPQTVHGLAGISRTIDAIAILADDDAGFRRRDAGRYARSVSGRHALMFFLMSSRLVSWPPSTERVSTASSESSPQKRRATN
jgi:hypothetical protein